MIKLVFNFLIKREYLKDFLILGKVNNKNLKIYVKYENGCVLKEIVT